MQVNPAVFREYDIRGIIDSELSEQFAFHLGRAIATTVRRGNGKKIVVGRDCRKSGIAYGEQLIKGLQASGCDVIDIGTVPTPICYWSIMHLGVDGGIQITGSHNPAEYNGFKMTLLGDSIYGDGIKQIQSLIEHENYEQGTGKISVEPQLDNYIHELRTLLKPAGRAFKVVVDAGNGTGGIAAVPLYRALGYDVIPMFCEMDGNFPNHHPDPTVAANVADLQARVIAEKADLGLAFDGDADRLGVIAADGEIIWGDKVLVVLARSVLAAVPGAKILGEVKCSKTLYDDIRKHGGQPVMGRTGHSLIKAKMKKEHIELAGEMSGHIFFNHRYYGFDDGIYAGGRLLEYLSSSPKTLTQELSDLPVTYATPELRFDCQEAEKFPLVARVIQYFQNNIKADTYQLITIDGARVEWTDAFGLVRASNTQPALVLRFEATTSARLQQLQHQFDQIIKQCQQELQ